MPSDSTFTSRMTGNQSNLSHLVFTASDRLLLVHLPVLMLPPVFGSSQAWRKGLPSVVSLAVTGMLLVYACFAKAYSEIGMVDCFRMWRFHQAVTANMPSWFGAKQAMLIFRYLPSDLKKTPGLLPWQFWLVSSSDSFPVVLIHVYELRTGFSSKIWDCAFLLSSLFAG